MICTGIYIEVLKICENSKRPSSIVFYACVCVCVCMTKHSAFNWEHELLITTWLKFSCGVPTSPKGKRSSQVVNLINYESRSFRPFGRHTVGVKRITTPCIHVSAGLDLVGTRRSPFARGCFLLGHTKQSLWHCVVCIAPWLHQWFFFVHLILF